MYRVDYCNLLLAGDKLGVTVYKCLHGQAPDYLSELCTPVTQAAEWQRLRSASRHLLIYSLFHGFIWIRTAVAPSLSLDQRHGTCFKTICVNRSSDMQIDCFHRTLKTFSWTVLATLSAIEALFFAMMRCINWHLHYIYIKRPFNESGEDPGEYFTVAKGPIMGTEQSSDRNIWIIFFILFLLDTPKAETRWGQVPDGNRVYRLGPVENGSRRSHLTCPGPLSATLLQTAVYSTSLMASPGRCLRDAVCAVPGRYRHGSASNPMSRVAPVR